MSLNSAEITDLTVRLKSKVLGYLGCYNFQQRPPLTFILQGQAEDIRLFLDERVATHNPWAIYYQLLGHTHGWHGYPVDAQVRQSLRQKLHSVADNAGDVDAAFILAQGYYNPLLQVSGDFSQDHNYDQLKVTRFYPARQQHLNISFRYLLAAARADDLASGNADARWILSQMYKNGKALDHHL